MKAGLAYMLVTSAFLTHLENAAEQQYGNPGTPRILTLSNTAETLGKGGRRGGTNGNC
jgi:hypothetical protein